MTLTIRAPGKLMIAGEYAVLGPSGEALAIAVAPGLEVTATPAPEWSLERADVGVRWELGDGPVPPELRFAGAALKATLRAVGPTSPHRLSTRVLGGTGTGDHKPGIGGSASACVGVVAAVSAAAGASVRPGDLLPIALDAHLGAQDGRGSGYDVATIAHGGLVHWRPTRLAGVGSVLEGEARRLDWPDGLAVISGYTGRSASTGGFIAKLTALAEGDRVGAARDLAAIGAPVGRVIDAFVAGSVPDILAGLSACNTALAEWDSRRSLSIVTPEVDAMIALARAAGAVAKVSGAGGGDSVLAFAADPAMLGQVAQDWSRAGFVPLPFVRDSRGVRVCLEEKTQPAG